MSMAVDLSTPLTKDEAKYLSTRGRDAELHGAAERHGQDVNQLLSGQAGDGTGPVVTPLGTGDQMVVTPDRLLAQLRDMGVNVQVVDEPVEDSDDSEEDDSEEVNPELSPYDDWSVKQLDAELKRRNLATTGDKKAKADRLYADDDQA
jgi:hypothetical protein